MFTLKIVPKNDSIAKTMRIVDFTCVQYFIPPASLFILCEPENKFYLRVKSGDKTTIFRVQD